ncbi:hypothetical protein CEUSTIGMA_g10243.t1 [Chlamydomonas eustigma]|uniref:Ribosomal protein L28 n=1 Tax=Chlamydomonas eustigma TaxID=1157962 RepID=A0A250XIA0_9CHLO|nr:hypothetical protein CEUSTIGMA_g10243.t1 [Chlamydomonas eustigma]|eukprot:GAX82817.1 hypothetical protein CEUSTIGMA_g10243.t1 [Chlamydomonas eustigma]
MSHQGTRILDRLIPSSVSKLKNIVENQRSWFWGDSELKLRIRKYKKSGEERVSVVLPQLHNVQLFSHTFQRFFRLKMTPHMIKTVEAKGGLDEYLLETPNRALNSDVASDLKWKIMKKKKTWGTDK